MITIHKHRCQFNTHTMTSQSLTFFAAVLLLRCCDAVDEVVVVDVDISVLAFYNANIKITRC